MTEPAVKYRLIKTEKHTGARLGEIITPHGTFPTPMFMPVGTLATVKSMSPEELDEMISTSIREYKKESKKIRTFKTNILEGFSGLKGLKGVWVF